MPPSNSNRIANNTVTMNQTTGTQQHIPTRTIEQVDHKFEQLGCLGHGGMGSVFLARKRSGRKVALKFMKINNEYDHECFTRETDAVSRLNSKNNKSDDDTRDLAIVFFEQWFTGPGFACIVMNYVDGGTLAQEICLKTDEPYTERRIGWYALQLCEALAYAHERGVAHHDVKSSNCLIDLSRGGRLLLADFGSAVAPGEDSVGFSEIYASPELIAAHAQDDYSNLEADKVDAFGLGCILFELLCCQKLVDLTGDQTLAEFIGERNVDAALDLACIQLPWLPATEVESSAGTAVIGYSHALRGLITTLLEPQPASRWTPFELQKPLRNDSQSPLVAKYVVAAQPPVPGAIVNIDNIQLGMFVQRGQDWQEGDGDGGEGSVGVIVKLDPDALYTEVAFPSRPPKHMSVEPMCCRIGAGRKFELQVGPTPIDDFVTEVDDEPMATGLLLNQDASIHAVGQLLNSNCMVVGLEGEQNLVFVAPLERRHVPTVDATPVVPPKVPRLLPRKPQSVPENWQPNSESVLVEVRDIQEKSDIVELFHSQNGGMNIQAFEITSIKRVQCAELWKVYAVSREEISAENWGLANDQRLFIGTGASSPESMLCAWGEFYQKCSSGGTDFASREIQFSALASWAERNSHRLPTGERQIVLSRVALGRVRDESNGKREAPHHQLTYHSEKKLCKTWMNPGAFFSIRNSSQAVPEYIISYKPLQGPVRRVVSARRPQGTNNSMTATSRRNAAHQQQRQRTVTSSGQGTSEAGRPSATVVNHEAKETLERATQGNDEQSKACLTKMCVVCLSKPVRRILLPCGHPCLCEICSTAQGLAKLRHKCPECRSAIREAATIYGRVMND